MVVFCLRCCLVPCSCLLVFGCFVFVFLWSFSFVAIYERLDMPSFVCLLSLCVRVIVFVSFVDMSGWICLDLFSSPGTFIHAVLAAWTNTNIVRLLCVFE